MFWEWRNYYIGTFTAVRGDGCPIAGQCVIEKVSNKDEAFEILKKETDNPNIYRYLAQKENFTETKLIDSPEDLAKIYESKDFEGDYHFYFREADGTISKDQLSLLQSGQAKLSIFNSIYSGLYHLSGPKAVHIQIHHLNKGGNPTGLQASLYIPGSRPRSPMSPWPRPHGVHRPMPTRR